MNANDMPWDDPSMREYRQRLFDEPVSWDRQSVGDGELITLIFKGGGHLTIYTEKPLAWLDGPINKPS